MRALQIDRSITRRDEKSLNHYLQDISRIDVLTIKEEVDLFNRLKQGDETALNKIVRHNLRFVVSVAKQYQNLGLTLNDLINEGNIGLIKAARRFDISRGFKFISYGVWWIRQSILAAIQQKSRKIKLPANQQSTSMKIQKERRAFVQQYERQPNASELAELTGLEVHHIVHNQQRSGRCRSLDAALIAGEDTTLGQLLEDPNAERPDFGLAVRESQIAQVQELLTTLPEREAKILSMHYGLGKHRPTTLRDIGELFGLSQERCRQLRDRSIRRLRVKGRDLQPALS